MKALYPHHVFKADFDELIQDAVRQESLDSSNVGEVEIATKLHKYFETIVIADILNDDSVYAAAIDFVRNHALQCIDYLSLGGQETFRLNNEFNELKKEIVELVKSLGADGFLLGTGEIALPKASSFYHLIDFNKAKLNTKLMGQIEDLHVGAIRMERLHLLATIRALRDGYETVLPRIMSVIRQSLVKECNIGIQLTHGELKGISEYISWYEKHIPKDHPLNLVFMHVKNFYKVARNVGNHHRGFVWDPDEDEIKLPDSKGVVVVSSHELLQKYRYLIYLNELGLRGILRGYAERAKDDFSFQLLKEYIVSFPYGFAAKEQANVVPYD